LTGRALVDVEGVDFELDVAQEGTRWKVVLRTVRQGEPAPRLRQLSGASCAEVTDAAAVAIAMAVNERQTMTEPESRAAEAAPSEPSSKPTQPLPSVSSAPRREVRPARSSAALSAAVALDGVLDVGALPNLAPGVELGVSAGFSGVKLLLLGSAFVAQQTRLEDGRGGEFRLLLGGALGCVQQLFGRIQGTACAGAELGQMAAEGLGVQHSRFGNRSWQAIRAEIGLTERLTPGLGLALRVAAIAPLARPEFVVDGAERVHRSSSLTGRTLLGIELQL
jgi:hypothetical protein